jgi:nucleotide-binding universal stress UspA family protein
MSIAGPVVYGDNGKHGAAFELALAEARSRRALLRVVHCVVLPTEESELFLSEVMYREMMAAGQTILDSTQALVERAEPQVAAEYVLTSGAPADVLVEQSRTAQLVVTGIDDIPWYDRLLGGAVAGRLARHCHCPLITVPDLPADPERHEGVVVALDGNSAARPLLTLAFDLAFDLAERRGCTLHAIRTISVGAVPEFIEGARATLGEVLAGWGERYPDVRVEQEVVVGEPSEAFIDATRHAEVVVVGRAGRHGVHRPTAASVVQHASCPVAVVPLDEPHA